MTPTLTLKIKSSKDGKKVTLKGQFKGVNNGLEFEAQPEDVKTLAAINATFLAFIKKMNQGE